MGPIYALDFREDIIDAVEGSFKVLSLNATHFGSDQEDPARAWVGLFRKR